jgi:hypothetical protein
MTTSSLRRLCLLVLMLALSGCDSTQADSEGVFVINSARYDTSNLTQYHLPKALREISGLALTSQHELLTHNDEVAVVYRVDYTKGRILGSFRLGQPPIADDFEGIAINGQRVFLITSTGSLYETRFPLFDDERETDLVVSYQHYPVALPCEVEGLATLSAQRLLALCKTLNDTDDVLRIYEWDSDANQYLDEPYLSLDEEAFSGLDRKLKKLRPAGLSVTDEGGLIIVGRHGKRPALIEISPQRSVVSLTEFPDRTRHRQPEGIALTRENWLVIADEGVKQDNGKKSKGKLGVYHLK